MTQTSLGLFQPIAPGVHVAVAEPDGVNIGLVVGSEGALLIDTGSTPQQGAAIRAAAEATAGVPLLGVLVTHWHHDHLFGLAAFTDLPSYAHETVPVWLSRPEGAAAAVSLGLDVADLARPTQLFSLAKVIDLGGRRVEAIHFGPGHTDGDVVAIIDGTPVIFAGDLLESSGPPAFGFDCNPRMWPSAVDGILGLVAEDSIVVPGHGPVMDRFACFEQRAQISGLYGQVEYLIGRGVTATDAFEQGEWPFAEATVREALPVIYTDFASRGIGPRRQLPLL